MLIDLGLLFGFALLALTVLILQSLLDYRVRHLRSRGSGCLYMGVMDHLLLLVTRLSLEVNLSVIARV